MGISTFPAASAGGITARTLKQKVFNTSGTWTYPTSSNFDGTVEVTCVGGGGGSGPFLSRQGTTGYFASGGGGGGQVISKKQLSVLSMGNQTITIGEGGPSYATTGALFGRPSTFGSGYIRNLYPDPTLSKGLSYLNAAAGTNEYPETYNSASASVEAVEIRRWTSGSNPPQPPAGTTYIHVSVGTNRPLYSQYVPVKASTSYRYIFSHTAAGGAAVTCTPRVFWYDSSGIFISSSAGTGFTTQTATGTWTAETNTFTSPATAVYARFNWLTSGSTILRFNGIQFAETAANVTSVVYGGASGYVWTGVPDNSYTIGENETLIVAQGGGGGWGAGYKVTSSGTPSHIPGHAGYTSGGFGIVHTTVPSGTAYYISGCGGGAGGNAFGPLPASNSGDFVTHLDVSTNSTLQHFKDGFTQWRSFYVDAHLGAAFTGADSSAFTSGNSSYKTFTNIGSNGEGIDGYGYGGLGAHATGQTGMASNFRSSGVNNPGISIQQQYYPLSSGSTNSHSWNGRPNTGNGANGGYTSGSNLEYEGATGGSGVVIVRWYE